MLELSKYLLGTRIISLDDKGRIAIPPLFKGHLTEIDSNIGLILQNKTIYLIPPSNYEKIFGPYFKMDFFNEKRQNFLGSIEEQTIDKQGRIIIPKYMRENLEIDYARAQVVLSGNIEGLVLRKHK